MTPERWAQIEELFHRAAECDPKERATLLDEECQGDAELRQEVESLLLREAGSANLVRVAVHSELGDFGFSLVGEVVSHYRILDGLGGGGMGLVYRAEDIKLGRQVALKFLPEESAKDPAALARFEREARAASALEHPNICPIYEFGEHEGQPFLVMQLLEGQTLRELICATGAKPPLALDRLLELAVQICEGLEAAHSHGIIHRDIKPANIFITTQGQAKILDFGLAKLSRGESVEHESEQSVQGSVERKQRVQGTQSPATPDPLLSRTGVAMGTAGYMSPEQARGEKLDIRTDLFSFGLVLYEMATGQRAFKGDTGPLLRDSILKQTPTPVRQLNAKLPPKLVAILCKALEKDREARYQTTSEVRADLLTLKRGIEPRSRAASRALATGVVTAVLITGAALLYLKRQPLKPTNAPVLKLRQLTINSSENGVTSGAISPDGKQLAYVDQRGMHLKLMETGETRSLPQPDDFKGKNVDWEVVSSGWFPDSTRFLVNAHLADSDAKSPGSSIWMVSNKDRAPIKLRDDAGAYSVSPDGSLISFGTNNGRLGPREIWLMQSDGERARKLFGTDENGSIFGLLWSPDGQRVIYVRTDELGDTFISRGLNGGSPATLFAPSETKNITDGLWLRDGRLIYSLRETEAAVESCNYWMTRVDLGTGGRIGKPERLTNLTGFCMNSSSVTSDGQRLTFLGFTGHATVYTADLEAGGTRINNPRHLTLDESANYAQGWTPDSKTLLFTSMRAGKLAIYKQSLNEDTPQLIAGGTVGFRQARVSPDGKWVMAFIAPKPGSPSDPDQLIRVPISGGSPELIFPTSPESGISCALPSRNLCVVVEASADHKQCVVTAFDPIKGRGHELARFEIDPNQHQWYCELAPDGTRLAVSPGPEGPLRVVSLEGTAAKLVPTQNLKMNSDLNWAANGSGFYFDSARKGRTVLLYLDLQGHTRVLWKNYGGNYAMGVPSPDGRHIAFAGSAVNSNMWMMENF